MNIDDIEQIVRILSQSDITDFELEQSGTRLHLVRTGGNRSFTLSAHGGAEPEPAITVAPGLGGVLGAHGAAKPTAQVPEHWVKVPSPIVGTFYRKPSPDAEAFVKEGGRISKGDTLCIVEAMKLMNEIESPCDGVVEKILLSDGQVVEYGEVLFLVNPS
jgi:acetyl-CoA carboxylase biotin carboxyl carrier protein